METIALGNGDPRKITRSSKRGGGKGLTTSAMRCGKKEKESGQRRRGGKR